MPDRVLQQITNAAVVLQETDATVEPSLGVELFPSISAGHLSIRSVDVLGSQL